MESPALAAVAQGIPAATLEAFEALRCELSVLDGLGSPAAAGASPAPSPRGGALATLDGNSLGAAFPRQKKGGLELSFRKTVSSPADAVATTPRVSLGELRTTSAYPEGTATTRTRALKTSTAVEFSPWTLPTGNEGMPPVSEAAPPPDGTVSAPVSPPELPLPAEVAAKLAQDTAMLDAEIRRREQASVAKVRKDADKRLQQVQKEAAEKVAATQRESQQQAVSSRQRTEAQVRDAQRLVRLEMEKELEQARNEAALQLRQSEQESAQHHDGACPKRR